MKAKSSHNQISRSTHWHWSNPLRYHGATARAVLTLLLAVGLLVSATLPTARRLLAQQPAAFLEITGVTVDDFPNIAVSVYGEGLDGGLGSAPMILQEDGVEQTITQSDMVLLGNQFVLAFDSSANVMNQTTKAAVDQAAQSLTGGFLASAKDWLAFVSFDHSSEPAKPVVVEAWNRDDHQKVINGLLTYNPTGPKGTTPLFELLRTALLHFDDKTPPANLARSIVVFSDGFNPLTVTEKDDLFREAKARRVRIHTVQLANSQNGEQQLRNLAQNANGLFFRLDPGNSTLDELWGAIKNSQTQRVLTYRSKRPGPKQVTVRANATDSRPVDAARLIDPFLVAPPAVTILKPDFGELEKTRTDGQPLEWDTPVTDLQPNVLEIGIEISWPDNHPRAIKQVEYMLADKTIAASAEPLTTIAFPMENFDQGDYTIRVRVTDELDLVRESDPKTLKIIVNRPPAPNFEATAAAEAANAQATTTAVAVIAEATTSALLTAQAIQAEDQRKTREADRAAADAAATVAQATAAALGSDIATGEVERFRLTIATGVSLALALSALGFAAYIWFNPRARRAATEFVKTAYATATQMWNPSGTAGPAKNIVRARLTYVGGAQSPQQNIDLYGGSTRLGRDAVVSNVVISDQRVSRYHCRISEEANGTFLLRDEGSTSGTYVNQEQVPMAGRVLQPGDLINIGPVQYQFDPLTVSSDTPTEIGTPGGMFIETEPYQEDTPVDQGGDNYYDPNATLMDTKPYDQDDPVAGAGVSTTPYSDNAEPPATEIGPVDNDSQATRH